jgi:hypothetical protein
MAKNDFLQRMKDREQAILDVGEEMGVQKMWDYLQVALRDERVVGTKRWGKDKFNTLYAVLREYANYFHDAFTMHPEADVRQDELDKILYEIWKEELQPFKERYPYCKEFSYKKSRKEWK